MRLGAREVGLGGARETTTGGQIPWGRLWGTVDVAPGPASHEHVTKPHLRPCPGCSRHVRVSEGACPFCGVSLDPSFAAAPVPVAPSKRLSRAALFAFGTGTLVLGPAAFVTAALGTDCSSSLASSYGASPCTSDCELPMADAYGAPPQLEDSSIVEPDVHVEGPDASDASASPDASDSSVESTDAADGSIEDAGADGATDAGDAD